MGTAPDRGRYKNSQTWIERNLAPPSRRGFFVPQARANPPFPWGTISRYTARDSIGACMRFVEGNFDDPRVIALLKAHIERARAETGRGSAHALDSNGLRTPDIRFWTAWRGDWLVGLGALKRLSRGHGEIKSMHTAEQARHQGVGRAMLAHIVGEAEKMGVSRLSLETGAWDYFVPARAFYRRSGFVECPPFADYKPDPNSIFMTRLIA